MAGYRSSSIPAIALALAITASLAGCGGSSESSGPTMPAGRTVTVPVSLNEMSIAIAPVPAAHGEVTFDVTNGGKVPHELVVVRTESRTGDLGPADSKGQVPETGSIGQTGDIAPGKSKTLKLKLAKGHYALICNNPGHYAAGMHTVLKVV